MEEKIQVLIVDDHHMFLDGLSSILAGDDQIDVAGVLTDAREVMGFLDTRRVDVVVTDVSMPHMDGIQLNSELKKNHSKLKTLVLTTHSDPSIIQKLIKGHVDGYLLKNAEKLELLTAIKCIAGGGKYFSDEVQKKYTESLFSNTVNSPIHTDLSKREVEILKLIIEEFTAQEIAEKLFISQHTVNTHRKNLLSKLGVKNTAGLVKHALQNGLIQ
ncbi:response regulator transcription factor [Reichenbachiella agarivorans]|uniref:Response regulator transcription factor n=1 Tax=Reichenbachiella agarivorans TaxID=2979464 RepID=A0ABY6CUN9_9BACT|nr:response regulator transcription factor [Reichenbachiella agarivorans]UXP34054.1 response regulator transcription factor [Reichenbachiella agarivorans]